MAARERIKEIDSEFHNASGQITSYKSVTEFMSEYYYPGSTPVLHWKTAPLSVDLPLQAGGKDRLVSACHGRQPILDYVLSYASEKVYLNSNKLPTNTGLNIIQTLAELDETLLLFTRKFWRSLSYGSFTWGVLPFVGELRSILTLIQNLERMLSSSSYEDYFDFPIPDSIVADYSATYVQVVGCHCKARLTGTVTLRDLGPSVWLDALGFYPDLATVWDLVPLSFVVNWLIPVGSYLESFRKNWLSHVPFQGWLTFKVKGNIEYHARAPYVPGLLNTTSFECFSRSFNTDILEIPNRNEVDGFEVPSLHELFNIFYIFCLGRQTRL